jgi:hypothetical protein
MGRSSGAFLLMAPSTRLSTPSRRPGFGTHQSFDSAQEGKSAPAQAPREGPGRLSGLALADSLLLASMSLVSTTIRPTPVPPKPPAPPPRVPHDPTRHPFTTPRFRTGPSPFGGVSMTLQGRPQHQGHLHFDYAASETDSIRPQILLKTLSYFCQ